MAQFAPPVKAPAPRQSARAAPAPMLQKKLQVGPADDHFEQEADRVAAAVMSASAAPVSIPPTITPIGAQRKTAAPKKEEEKKPAAPAPATVQRKAAPSAPAKRPEEEKKPSGGAGKAVQREAFAGAQGGTASAPVDSAIQALRSGPAPGLDGATRAFMEGRFGRDFGDVRVHHGPRASETADAVGARAFTTGNDIFFNSGQYRPHSSGGRRLLAHELAHTVQQSGAGGTAARKLIQRTPPPPPPPSATPAPVPPAGSAGVAPVPTPTSFDVPGFAGARIDTTNTGTGEGTIVLPSLGLPQIAGALKGTVGGLNTPEAAGGRSVPSPGAAFTLTAPQPRRESTVAADTWTAGARSDLKAGVRAKLQTMLTANPNADTITVGGIPYYYMTFVGTASGRSDYIFNGTLDELSDSEALLRPQWSSRGTPLTARDETLDADHFLEAQLGGADTAANMWLLQASYNRSVGSQIAGNVRRDIDRAIAGAGAVPEAERPARPAVDTRWDIRFATVERGTGFARATQNFWARSQISNGDHLNHLRFMTEPDLIAADIKLQAGQRPRAVKVFPTPAGGRMIAFPFDSGGTVQPPRFFYNGIHVNTVTYHGTGTSLAAAESPLLTLNVSLFKYDDNDAVIEERQGNVIVKSNPRLGIAGYLSADTIRAAGRTTAFTKLSPLTFSDMGVSAEGDLIGTGSVLSSKAVFPGLNVPLQLRGDRILMNFPVPGEGFSLGPLRVTETALSLGVGEHGLFVEGFAGFELGSLGRGSVIAELSENPRLTGNFNLDMDFLDPASVTVTYDIGADTLSASATLGVQSGRIPGVESGQVTVGISREAVNVSGTLSLGGPLRGTIVNVTYNQTDGLKIGADNIPLPLSSIPAIQNATLSISATRSAETGAWSFAGTGQATLAVPGATGTITISYLDGAVTFSANAQLAKGPATGTLNFTATNRAIDEEGRPIEGPPVDAISVWGRGTVTIQFGNVLTGTAGVELTPDNRVIISGTIGLPPVFEVFPRREYNKDLFTLEPPEFPIWGVSVAGVGVGIFAFVNARVFFNAYVGPGEIRDAQIGATMDLDRPEDASVTGHAEFHVPAYAGLGLDVGGGLRARLAVAYAEGRVGLTGELGIQADASAAIDVAWSRAAGLALSADLSAQAQPKFSLSANASVTVGVDLLVTDVSHTFGPWTKELGSFGPDMTLGVTMPVRWSEANGLDLSLDNIEITRPSLDASALMSSVFDQLAA